MPDEKDRKLISIVVPVFNEVENIRRCVDKVSSVMAELADRYEYEILFTDNHSTDDTFQMIRALAQDNRRIKAIRFSRNFGYQRSILTGYMNAAGDAAIQLDVDLEDPPELIPRFLELWEEGYQVVYGVRTARKESWFKTFMRRVFYRLINAMSEDHLPPDAGDFRLIDRKVIDQIGSFSGASPYLRGTIASLGFKQQGVEYKRDARVAGRSKFNIWANTTLALDGIVNHSLVPLRIATVFGLVVGFGSIVLAIVYMILRLGGIVMMPPGFATLIIVMLMGIAMNSIFFGILGEYVGRVLFEARKYPHVAVEESVNVVTQTNTQ